MLAAMPNFCLSTVWCGESFHFFSRSCYFKLVTVSFDHIGDGVHLYGYRYQVPCHLWRVHHKAMGPAGPSQCTPWFDWVWAINRSRKKTHKKSEKHSHTLWSYHVKDQMFGRFLEGKYYFEFLETNHVPDGFTKFLPRSTHLGSQDPQNPGGVEKRCFIHPELLNF